ncbi:MAG TPA: DoxX family protein [Steroidobacteraceae bacterium]|nr:DoxX family protein [Steroidobacteraceae bacterium]
MNTLEKSAELLGRIFLVVLFALAAVGKLSAYAGTQAYMQSAGVPGMLLPLVIVTELGGAALIALGWQTRIAAFLLAGFTLLAALIFHHQIGDATQQLMLLKDISITGGFLLLAARGAGPWSLDARRRR